MDNFNRIYNILWSIFAFGSGLYLLIYTEQFIKLAKRRFNNLYQKTGFFLFKLQAESIDSDYIHATTSLVGLFFAAAGVLIFLQNI